MLAFEKFTLTIVIRVRFAISLWHCYKET